MAFEIIFGKGTVPGCEAVYKKLLALENREDVTKFRNEIRLKAAGGEKATKYRKRRIVELELAAHLAEEAGQIEEAYSCYVEASDIRGIFTPTTINSLAALFLRMYRLKAAMGMLFLMKAIFSAHESLDAKIGETIDTLNGCSGLNNGDLSLILERISEIDNQIDWADRLYLVLLAIYQIETNPEEAKTILTSSKIRQFFNAIGKSETISRLLEELDLAVLKVNEIYFLTYLFKLFREIRGLFDYSERHLLQTLWYNRFLRSFSSSLVSHKFWTRLARCQNTEALRFLVIEYINFTATRFYPLLKAGENEISLDIPYPFNSFSWYCHACLFFLFSEKKEHNSEWDFPFFSTYFSKLFVCALVHSQKLIRRDAEKTDPVEWAKLFDLLLLRKAVNFAEWKHGFLEGCGYKEGEETATFQSELAYSPDEANALSTHLGSNEMCLRMLRHGSLFALSAAKVYFFAENIARLRNCEEDGDSDTILAGSIACVLSLSCSRHLSNVRVAMETLLKCPEMSPCYLKSLIALVTHNYVIKKSGYAIMVVTSLTKFIALVSAVSLQFFREHILTDENESLAACLFEHQVKVFRNYQCIATLLRCATEQKREIWGQCYQDTFKEMGEEMLRRLLNDTLTPNVESANLILAFHSLIGRSPPVVSLQTIINVTGFGPNQMKRILLKLTKLAVGKFFFEDSSKIPPTPEMRCTCLILSQTIASILIASLCDINSKFRAVFLQREFDASKNAILSIAKRNLARFPTDL